MPAHLHDLTDRRFGQLRVIRSAPRRSGRTWWVCVCDCTPGREVEMQARLLTRRERPVRSCGCLKRDNAGTLKCKPDDQIGYVAAHGRVYRARGPASAYRCVSCPQPALDWALKRAARGSQADAAGAFAGHPFSSDPDDYQPMCRSCHSRYDRAAA